MKSLPQRTCIGCNQIKLKKELIRIVKNKEDQIFICDNIECLEKAIKTKRLERSFETQISDDIYNQLRETIK